MLPTPRRNSCLAAMGLVLATVCIVYGGFLWSPVVFDDASHFNGAIRNEYLTLSYVLSLRWLPYATFEWTRVFFGLDLIWFRLGNLALHLANLLLLFAFLRRLFERVLKNQTTGPSTQALALSGTALFGLHPASVYAVAYLTQRSTLMATLFVLVMLNVSLLALSSGRRRDWLASVAMYFLAVMNKELSVMAPMLVLLLVLLLRHSHIRISWRHGLLVGSAYLLIAALAAYLVKQGHQVFGEAFQLNGEELLRRYAAADPGFSPALAYPLSILTQATLFFKYLLVWLIPSAQWMSVDMYEPLAARLWAWPYLLGLTAYAVWGLLGARLLWRGGRAGLLGFAMLCPWLMFITEFSTVRVAEPFVIYRSYLWTFCLSAALPWVFQNLNEKAFTVVSVALTLLLIPPTLLRLQTFSSDFLLWDDAARLVEKQPLVPGIERVYANRANAESRLGRPAEALKDYDTALRIYPHANVHSDRGATLLLLQQDEAALEAFQMAVGMEPNLVLARLGIAYVLEKQGRTQAAIREYRIACTLGSTKACDKQ